MDELKAIFPQESQARIASVLEQCNGDVARAADTLAAHPQPQSEQQQRPQQQPPVLRWSGGAGQPAPPLQPTAGRVALAQAQASTPYPHALPYPPQAAGPSFMYPPPHSSAPNAYTPIADAAGVAGVNAAARRRIREMLPHEQPERIEEALRSHNGGLTQADEEAAVNSLLGGGQSGPAPAAQQSSQPVTGVPVVPQAQSIPLQPMVGQQLQPPPHPANPYVHHPQQASSGPASASRPPPNLPPTRALSVNAAPPRLSGRRKALLIGINYDGTPAQLRGCVNDVASLNSLLTQKYGWPRECIHALTDDGRGGPAGHPTRANILSALRWLAQDAAPGDVLFLAFSGHGAQKPDPRGVEEDGMNETILPVDWQTAGMITDDEIAEVCVHTLPDGVRMTCLMDSCHSGTGLDLPFSWTPRGWREEVNPYHSLGDVQMISGCEDGDTSCDAAGLYSAPGGAMTTAFCDVLRANAAPTYGELLEGMYRHIARRGMTQRPQLSSTQCFHFERPFLLDDVVPNTNPVIGRTMRHKFPPRPRPMEGPLAGMLGFGAAVVGGLLVGEAIGDMVATEGAGDLIFGGLSGGFF